MSWYTASLLFKATHVTREELPALWEERCILLEVATEEQAEQEATRIGKSHEHEYQVLDGKPGEPPGKLKWTFEQIVKICYIENDRLAHGTELFYRFFRDPQVKSLLTPFNHEE